MLLGWVGEHRLKQAKCIRPDLNGVSRREALIYVQARKEAKEAVAAANGEANEASVESQ